MAVLVVVGAPARAQDGPVPAGSAPDIGPTEVIITGSRIPTPAANETLPVVVLDSADLRRGGLDSVGKVLQQLPMSAASVENTNQNLGGTGASRVDLRALSPKRTLVLLNGHRLPNGGVGGDNSVDIDSIPMELIERVEVLTAGASTVYGADAVAGVVNLITRSSLKGLSLDAEHSESDRGDGQIETASMAAGGGWFGGQWLFGGRYVHQRGVSSGDRGFSAVPVQIADLEGDTQPVGSFTLPQGVFGVPEGNALGLPGGYYTHIDGTTGRTAADYRSPDNNDIFNFSPYEYLQTPNTRESAWLIGTQPLATGLDLHVEGLFSHRRSSQSLAPTPYSATFDASPQLADGSAGIPASNYYNPFGADLGDARRRFVEINARGFTQSVDSSRVLLSLSVQLGSWKLEPAVSYAQSHATERDFGAIAGSRLQTAIGPSGLSASGDIVCGNPDATGTVPAGAIIAGCVPIDLFGGVGSITPRQVAYLEQNLTDHGTDSQEVASLDAHGPWGRTWAGNIRWAAGAEYRREAGSYIFDSNRGGGAVGSGGQQDIPSVAFSAREAYVETRVPLVRQGFLAEELDASAGFRWSDFSSFGDHVTWQAGLRWQPVGPVTFRSNYTRVFRAPAIFELYSAQGASSDIYFDPCGNSPSPIQQQHCAANGVPGGAYVQSDQATFTVSQGGNPNLAPESGYSVDGGLDFRLESLPELRASLDVYQISLNGYIATPAGGAILEQCADAGRPDVCGLIRRAPDGNVVALSDLPRNFGKVVVAGADATAGIAFTTAVGRVGLGTQNSYLSKHDTQIFPGTPTAREAGMYSRYAFALPRWRSLTHVDLETGHWRFSYQAQWIGGYSECGPVDFQDVPFCRHVAGVVYHDAQAGYSFGPAVSLRIGVTNITDRQPPFLNFGNELNTDTTTYRLLGRTAFAALHCQLF
jgi:iron complex outermembrane receptor protein